MSIIIPIMFCAVLLGLFREKITWREWLFMIVVVVAVMIKNY